MTSFIMFKIGFSSKKISEYVTDLFWYSFTIFISTYIFTNIWLLFTHLVHNCFPQAAKTQTGKMVTYYTIPTYTYSHALLYIITSMFCLFSVNRHNTDHHCFMFFAVWSYTYSTRWGCGFLFADSKQNKKQNTIGSDSDIFGWRRVDTKLWYR